MKKLTIIFCILPTLSFAQTTISDQDLNKAYEVCSSHKSVIVTARIPKWASGWEHCEAIDSEYEARKLAKEKSSEFSKEISKQLEKKTK